jgi:hypothetical protein
MFDQLHIITIFTKIDLRNEYHQIWIWLENEWNTTFKLKEGLYEGLFISFKLSSMSSTFIQVMNKILCFFINKFVVIYFIDILIYSRSETDHIEHLKKVLEVLLENKLYMNLKKYCFITNNLLFFKLYC